MIGWLLKRLFVQQGADMLQTTAGDDLHREAVAFMAAYDTIVDAIERGDVAGVRSCIVEHAALCCRFAQAIGMYRLVREKQGASCDPIDRPTAGRPLNDRG